MLSRQGYYLTRSFLLAVLALQAQITSLQLHL
jgi:hypothetical protein